MYAKNLGLEPELSRLYFASITIQYCEKSKWVPSCGSGICTFFYSGSEKIFWFRIRFFYFERNIWKLNEVLDKIIKDENLVLEAPMFVFCSIEKRIKVVTSGVTWWKKRRWWNWAWWLKEEWVACVADSDRRLELWRIRQWCQPGLLRPLGTGQSQKRRPAWTHCRLSLSLQSEQHHFNTNQLFLFSSSCHTASQSSI